MKVSRSILAVLASVTVSSIAAAQTTVSMGVGQGGSPHEKTTWMVNGATVSIEYGRPFLKKRPESQMMPVGEPWRTGADEATVVTTDKPLTFGALHLKPGSYTITLTEGTTGPPAPTGFSVPAPPLYQTDSRSPSASESTPYSE